MADAAISALSAVTTPASTDEIPVNQGGTTKKLTLTQVNTYCEPVCNASIADQSPFTTELYLIGSSILIPNGRLKAGSFYECEFNITKTAAGVAAPLVNVRTGTIGSVGDTSRATLTHGAQTAVADEGIWRIQVGWRSVGSGTSAVFRVVSTISHEKGFGTASSTGLSVTCIDHVTSAGAGYDSTVSNTIIGLSILAGASASWTVNLVTAKLLNLA